MERSLFEALWAGDLTKLRNLVTINPRIIHSSSLIGNDNPLHIACMASHHEIVKELIKLKRNLAYDLNGDGLSSLHIAATNGDLNIVKALLNINNGELCRVEGKEGCIPLHYAVIKGRMDIVKELIGIDPHSIEVTTALRETILHLAIKNYQFKTLQILVDHLKRIGRQDLLRNKDHQGNTILHLATSREQYEVILFLLGQHGQHGQHGEVSEISEIAMVDVNAVNEKGQTPLDVLQVRHETLSCDNKVWVEDILKQAGGKKGEVIHKQSKKAVETHDQLTEKDISWFNYFKYKEGRDSPGDVRNCLLVLVALIITVTYQTILSPPGGLWQDSSSVDGKHHIAGGRIMQTYSPVLYGFFLYFNTIGFSACVYMTYLLTVGFPLKFELNLALFAIVITYEIAIVAFTPKGAVPTMFLVFSMLEPFATPYWIRLYRAISFTIGGVTKCMGEPKPKPNPNP